ncbi:hypothetical protein EK904_012562 [Melospiza melodia maxima]|nr:hypothetical protein EK904_012562 [Melospiza melodia maxima]
MSDKHALKALSSWGGGGSGGFSTSGVPNNSLVLGTVAQHTEFGQQAAGKACKRARAQGQQPQQRNSRQALRSRPEPLWSHGNADCAPWHKGIILPGILHLCTICAQEVSQNTPHRSQEAEGFIGKEEPAAPSLTQGPGMWSRRHDWLNPQTPPFTSWVELLQPGLSDSSFFSAGSCARLQLPPWQEELQQCQNLKCFQNVPGRVSLLGCWRLEGRTMLKTLLYLSGLWATCTCAQHMDGHGTVWPEHLQPRLPTPVSVSLYIPFSFSSVCRQCLSQPTGCARPHCFSCCNTACDITTLSVSNSIKTRYRSVSELTWSAAGLVSRSVISYLNTGKRRQKCEEPQKRRKKRK